METYDIVIIGAGPAGMTAAIYAVRANMKTLLLDKLSPGGQIINTESIENYTGVGAVNGAELAMKMFEHTQELGVVFDYKTVLSVEDQGTLKVVRCEEDDAVYSTRTVLIATGASPRRLGVPGEDNWAGAGLSWCAICDGAQYKGKDVVVIGGGNSAVEESLYLAGIVNKLTLVVRSRLSADNCVCDKLRAMPNVSIYGRTDVLSFIGQSRLEGVRVRDAESGEERIIACDGVFEYIGLEPVSAPFASLGILDARGCIPVNEDMKTAVDGIYAAGDITAKKLRQVITACSDGAIAANAASKYIESLCK